MISASPWSEHLAAHRAPASAGDPEAVHQLRVAAGRLVVWLDLAERRILRDDLLWLRRALAVARDLDVLLSGHPPQPVARWARARRGAETRIVASMLGDPRVDGLVRGIASAPAIPRRRAELAAERFARRARIDRFDLHDPAQLHPLRRAVRRARYALEWIDRRRPDLERLQDALGEYGDAVAARDLVASCPSASAAALGRFDDRVARMAAVLGEAA